MGATTGLHPENPFRRKHPASGQKFSVFFREDVIGHDPEAVLATEPTTQRLDQGGLSRSHRTPDADDRDPSNPGPGGSPASRMITMMMLMSHLNS
jgi:hypothetical protein